MTTLPSQTENFGIYAPPVFTSRDPLFEQKPWLSPYHYCSNNPVGRVDPSGMTDEYTWVKTGDGRIVFNSAVHTDADAEEIYGEGSSTLAYGEEHKTNKGNTCTLEKGGFRVNGQFHKVKDEAPFFKKVGKAIRSLDEGGHSDGGNSGKITQQDVTVGLAVISAMTGVGAAVEVAITGKIGACIVSSVGVLNSIDDACTDASGRSAMERISGENHVNIVKGAKTAIDVSNFAVGAYGIIKEPVPFGVMSTISSAASIGVGITNKINEKR